MILVTGGAGFIGSHIVDELLARGIAVRVVDSLHPKAHAERPKYLRPPAEYITESLASADLEAALAGVTAVCHQSAMVGLGDVGFADAPDFVWDNDLCTAKLLAAVHDLPRSRRPDRFVLASSMVVYGEGVYLCRSHGTVRAGDRDQARLSAGRWEAVCPECGRDVLPLPVREDVSPQPRSVYAATKLHQEHLAFASLREGGPPVTALRYHNVYGPRLPPNTPYAGVAAIFRSAACSGRPPQVFEDGSQRRDFVHVRDVARANVLALLSADPVVGAFNIASGTPRTVFELAAGISAGCGGPPPRVVGGFRSGDARHIYGSPDLARSCLGFQAEVDFDEGIAELVTEDDGSRTGGIRNVSL